jgi:hypothetical protein
MDRAMRDISIELEERCYFQMNNRLIEAQRIEQRTNFDVEMIRGHYCQESRIIAPLPETNRRPAADTHGLLPEKTAW